MGFYIRKSFNFGPFRLNLSKKGIGTSVGVKGLRVSSGPRGTELHAGGYGLYYREKLDGAPQSEDIPPVQARSEAEGIPTIQARSEDDDIPPIQRPAGYSMGSDNLTNNSLGFALIVLAVIVVGFLALVYFFG